MSYKDNLPKTMDELKALSFDERARLWAKYSQYPFKRQMRSLWYYIQCATAWKYRELYEQDGNVDNIIHKVRTSPRLFYKYLALSYLNPNIVNKLLKGKLNISVRDILDKASRSDDFKVQDKMIMGEEICSYY